MTGERKIKVGRHASSAHFLDNHHPLLRSTVPGRYVYNGRRTVQRRLPRTLRHTPKHLPMSFRITIPVNATQDASAESGRLMYDDAEHMNLNPRPAFRPVGAPISNPYQFDSRFANPLTGSLNDVGFPIPVFQHLGGHGTNRDATYLDTISPLSGTRLEVSAWSSVDSPSNGQTRKRPGRGGRQQCESCRRQKNGIEVQYHRKEMSNVNFSVFHILMNHKDAPTV